MYNDYMGLIWKIKELHAIKIGNKNIQKILNESKGMIYDLSITVPKETLWEYIGKSIKRTIRKIKRKLTNNVFEPSLEKVIDEDYSDDRIHKRFFKKT